MRMAGQNVNIISSSGNEIHGIIQSDTFHLHHIAARLFLAGDLLDRGGQETGGGKEERRRMRMGMRKSASQQESVAPRSR